MLIIIIISISITMLFKMPYIILSYYHLIVIISIIADTVSQTPAEVCLKDLAWDYPGV